MQVESTGGVSVAVHELGGDGPPLLFSHATGFHTHCYLPIARELSDRFTTFGLDHRGHGQTRQPAGLDIDWEQYGDDALAAAEAVAPDGGLIGFGHSMGGTSLLMAAHRHPGLFDLIVAFEPIVFPQKLSEPGDDPSAMVQGARNRRDTFESEQAAIDNYGAKPPMKFFVPEVLRLYVEHGFEPCDDGVTLRCRPAHEALTFEQGASHDMFQHLVDVQTRVVIVSGKVEVERSPAGIARRIADRLPNGAFVEVPTGNHLTPFIEPATITRLILDAI